MPQRSVTVGSQVGLHAKSAGLISAVVFDAGQPVWVSVPDRPEQGTVNASSALVLMTLGADHGETVVVECEDAGLLEKVVEMVKRDLSSLVVSCRERAT